MNKYKTLLISGLLILIVDRIVKITFLGLGATHLNSGVAFSIAAGSSLVIFLIIIGTIALLYLAKNLDLANLWVQVSLGLIVGGGLSNIIDRIFFGSVVDYIRILDLTVFNLADAGIIVGVGILIFKVLNKKTNS